MGKLLPPIIGYTCQPLVTLDCILPKPHPYISIARNKSEQQMNDLTLDERAEIRLYTTQGGGYNNSQNISLYSQL